MSDTSARRRMGFKHAMLQRSYDLSPSPARTSPTHNGAQNLAAGPQMPPVQVTDFSISKILGKDRKPAQDTSTSILDLSKSSSLSLRSPPTGGSGTAPGTGLAMSAPYGGYSMLPPDLVAMANATKFYAQFFPHLLPAYAAAAAAAGLSTPPTSPYPQHHHPQQTLPSQQKRFFAPYVINAQAQAPQQPLIRPKSTACTRPDCLECLDYYQRLQAGGGYKQATPLISPAASSVSSSSGSVRPVRDLIMSAAGGAAAATSISLTTVTNLSLSSVQTSAVGLMPKMAGGGLVSTAVGSGNGIGGVAGYNPTSPEEISYKCRICEKVFGCSETLQPYIK
ncbi:uncharacterized protein LOC108029307 isoform X2 [Drosophila biarmipes]|uniref:uncharacterized protein LOC108029307 isoform X2 n=1 Tax=Drosophila biarmipes TaxID=125945 RepID=UPI0021CD0990|nr:uncharacterized protein LOC108029307 isoform X2 [Drosophila biarmipes]